MEAKQSDIATEADSPAHIVLAEDDDLFRNL